MMWCDVMHHYHGRNCLKSVGLIRLAIAIVDCHYSCLSMAQNTTVTVNNVVSGRGRRRRLPDNSVTSVYPRSSSRISRYMWIWTLPTNLQNFTKKSLTEVKIFQKDVGEGATFFEKPCMIASVLRAYTSALLLLLLLYLSGDFSRSSSTLHHSSFRLVN